MEINEIRQIVSWLDEVDIYSIELTRAGTILRVKMSNEAGPFAHRSACANHDLPEAQAVASDGAVTVTAASVGVFLRVHPYRASPLVSEGDAVQKGDIVGLLRVAQLLLPVYAPQGGLIASVMVADGAAVGFGTPLMALKRSISNDSETGGQRNGN